MTLILVKFVHVAAIAIWSAGLIALPFIYRQRRDLEDVPLFRLQAFTRAFYVMLVSPAAFLAVGSGTLLIFLNAVYEPWFSVKLALVGMMVLAHVINGLTILKVFDEGYRYPVWRFMVVTSFILLVVSSILLVVLGKPELERLRPFQQLLTPGGLGEFAAPFIAWWR